MALSLSNFLFICAAAPALSGLFVHAKNVTYDFNITWVNANPDGLFARPVIGINGQWPIPEVRVTKGDRLITHVHNQLGNQSTSMHYHGMYHQYGSNEMDGPVGVTQCAIPAGKSMTYDFVVDQPGTYWYHSHDKGQYPDGFRGAMLVDDPDSPYKNMYDGEIVVRLSDWYHEQMPVLLQRFISVANPTGAEPVPDAALINDSQNVTIAVEPGKTYYVRIINVGAFAGQYFWFQGHTMRIIEVDGVYTEPAEAEMIYLTAAQRYGVLLTTKNETTANYPFMTSMDQTLFDVVPPTLNPNATGWLTYNEKAEKPKPTFPAIFTPFNDYTLVPYDHRELLEPVDHQIVLDLKMDDLSNGANYAFFNDITYVAPRVPTLYSVLSSGQNASSAEIYGVNTNPYILQYGEVVEIVLNNNDGGRHPFHLHGHAFQAVERPHAGSGTYNGTGTPSQIPMRRDTFMVMPNSHFVIRFRANNPGVWFFHCHIDWHLVTGLAATMIEAPLEIQQRTQIPDDHYQVCYDQSQPTKGNAAGNTADLFDLSGEPTPPAPLPAGFTAKGIVALVFSCLAAFMGMAVITWYGVAPLGTAELAHAQHRIKDAGVS